MMQQQECEASVGLTDLIARFYSVREDAENFILSLVSEHGSKIGSDEVPISFTVDFLGTDDIITSAIIESINNNGEITMENEKIVALSSLMVDSLIFFSEELECKKNECLNTSRIALVRKYPPMHKQRKLVHRCQMRTLWDISFTSFRG